MNNVINIHVIYGNPDEMITIDVTDNNPHELMAIHMNWWQSTWSDGNHYELMTINKTHLSLLNDTISCYTFLRFEKSELIWKELDHSTPTLPPPSQAIIELTDQTKERSCISVYLSLKSNLYLTYTYPF